MEEAKVKLSSKNPEKLEELTEQIIETAKEYNAKISGPVPLPTKKLKVPVRKSPCGDGTATYDRWEMHIHKRLVGISDSERALRQIMRVHVPEGVNIEVELVS